MCLYGAALAFQMPVMHAGHAADSVADPFSLFNHHLAGVLVIFVAVFTFLEESTNGNRPWVKYLWPFPLIVLSLYLLLRSDNDLTWPLQLSVWMPDVEAVQHKLFALLALALGGVEFLRRTGRLKHPAWRYIFYSLIFAGGVFLVFHSGVQHTHLIHLQHIRMGTTAVAIGGLKLFSEIMPHLTWLRLYLVPSFFLALGLQLAFYVE